MAEIIDSKSATQKLLEVKNGATTVLSVNGAGSVLDKNDVNRVILNPTAKTIVDGSATSLFEVPITAGQIASGIIHFSVVASDATDFQVISGIATYGAVNKAGTITRTVTYATANEAKAVSAGTITLSFTATDDTNKVTIKLQPTGSLTETTYNVMYNVFPFRGTVTIL